MNSNNFNREKMSDILKNGHKGWSEADLTQEPRFLPGWLPQKPLETLGFICKWSPLRTKGFNRKSNEQNWWVSLSQIGPSHCSEKRFPGPGTILIQLPWGTVHSPNGDFLKPWQCGDMWLFLSLGKGMTCQSIDPAGYWLFQPVWPYRSPRLSGI